MFPGLTVPGGGASGGSGRRGSTLPSVPGSRRGSMFPGLSVSPGNNRRGSRVINSMGRFFYIHPSEFTHEESHFAVLRINSGKKTSLFQHLLNLT